MNKDNLLDKHIEYLKGLAKQLDETQVQTRPVKEGESIEAADYIEVTEKLMNQISARLKVIVFDLTEYFWG